MPHFIKDGARKLTWKLRHGQNAHKTPTNYNLLEHSPVSHMLLDINTVNANTVILIKKQYIEQL